MKTLHSAQYVWRDGIYRVTRERHKTNWASSKRLVMACFQNSQNTDVQTWELMAPYRTPLSGGLWYVRVSNIPNLVFLISVLWWTLHVRDNSQLESITIVQQKCGQSKISVGISRQDSFMAIYKRNFTGGFAEARVRQFSAHVYVRWV